MLTSRLAIAAVLASVILPLAQPAAADGRGNGNGAAGCPPGLAKKNPPCVPPGLARNGTTPEDWAEERGYDLGDLEGLLSRRENGDDDGHDDDGHDDENEGDGDSGNRLTLRDLIQGGGDGSGGGVLPDGERRPGSLADLLGGGENERDGIDPVLIRSPERFGLAPESEDMRYFLLRDTVVSANPKTGRILSVIGLAEAILK